MGLYRFGAAVLDPDAVVFAEDLRPVADEDAVRVVLCVPDQLDVQLRGADADAFRGFLDSVPEWPPRVGVGARVVHGEADEPPPLGKVDRGE